MIRLVEADLVAPDWDKNKYNGIAQDSVVVMTVRKGNPEGLESLDDLLTKDVEIITPNPFSSGAARWNIMAIYGSQLHEGKSPQEALAAVKTVLEKTAVQPGSARDALAAFTQGAGDVLLGYENEAIKAQEEGEDVDYVIPPSTILIETPIAVTKEAPEAAQKFLDYIWSDAGQELWAENGYRPVNPDSGRPEAVPDPRGPVHDRRVRRLGKSQRRVLRRRNRLGSRDREGTRSLDERLMDAHPASVPPVSAAPRAGIRLPGLGVGLGRGLVVLYLSLMVMLPLAAVVDSSTLQRARRLLEVRHRRAGDGGAETDRDLLADRRRDQRRLRHGDRLGPGPRRVPRQGGGQRPDRPALRAADDRRRPDPADPLRVREPDRPQRRLHPGGGR